MAYTYIYCVWILCACVVAQTQAICKCRITARAITWSTPYFPNVSIFLLTALNGLPENPGISFDVFNRCFCKVETRVCVTLLSCAKRVGGLAVTTLPGASSSFNPVLHMAYGFISCTSDFTYLCSEKTPCTYSMCGGIKTLKHNVWTTLRLAYHGCKYLTHTSKTRQVKRTHMAATGRFTIRAFVTFSDC